MSLLNYSTKIEAEKTAMEISKILSMIGASAILTEYDTDEDGYKFVSSLAFKITTNGNTISFKLPTQWEPVLNILKEDHGVPRRMVTQEQAIRVAWRIVKAWVEAQVALIEVGMVRTEQVFLPYAQTKGGSTLGQDILDNPQKLLE